ncbi:MAG: acylphosphatase [Planctomycetes bacterium]|jgi:acylphosphatase|nr:acylphosphatase [Planctomycetota bacterium]
MAEQRIVHFKGNVQGVGFRYATTRTANDYDVTGYVKNLPDGRVELVAEGERKEIDAFVNDVRDRMSGHIRGVSRQTAPASGNYSGFGVKH